MQNEVDLSEITACGECCVNCKKKESGMCKGCIESDGHCEEWIQSGCCPIHKCTREHIVQFCGLCNEFPCGWLVEKIVHLAPFTGFQMFCGEPKPHTISFMQVIGIERMHDYIITSTRWDKITEVVTQPWGGKTCSLTTIDGYVINIFE